MLLYVYFFKVLAQKSRSNLFKTVQSSFIDKIYTTVILWNLPDLMQIYLEHHKLIPLGIWDYAIATVLFILLLLLVLFCI